MNHSADVKRTIDRLLDVLLGVMVGALSAFMLARRSVVPPYPAAEEDEEDLSGALQAYHEWKADPSTARPLETILAEMEAEGAFEDDPFETV